MVRYWKLIWLLLFAFSAQAQSLDFLVPRSVDETLDADYALYVEAVEDAGIDLSDEIKFGENAFVIQAKADGHWTRMKTGYFFFAGGKAATKINLKNPATYLLTEGGTVAFDEGAGIRSDGTASYYNQPFKSDEYSGIQTDLTMIQYIVEDNATARTALSHGMRSNLANTRSFAMYPYYSAGLGYKTHGSASFEATTTSNHKGLYTITYDGTNVVWYKDGVKDSDAATPDVPNLSINRLILSTNGGATTGAVTPVSFYTHAVTADFLFDRFTDADELAFRTNFTTNIVPLLNQNRIENAVHCWFTENRAVYHAGTNKTWFSQVHGPSNANYYQYIFELDNSTGVITKFQLGTLSEKDDHNESSILIRASDSRLFTCYTEHALPGSPIRYRVSTNPLDASAWGSQLTKDPDGAGNHTYTYPSCWQVTNGDIYIFYRDTDLVEARWAYIKSTDNGVTFGSPTSFWEKTYLNIAQDPNNANILHFAGSFHPNELYDPNSVSHCYFNAGTGTWHKSDGTNVSANLPLDDPNLTTIFPNVMPQQGWIEDIMVDGSGYPRVLMTYYPDVVTTTVLKDLYYSEWTGTAWTTPYKIHQAVNKNMGEVTLVNTYSSNSTFDRGNINRIFCGKQVGSGNTEIFKLTRVSSTSFTSEQLTFNSGHDQWRPFTVAAPVNNVFWTNKIFYNTYISNFKQDLRYATH